ncbi:NlpC/P60 family protein [Peribacillus butanolivorans]|uniref:NlpC/P60 family protein n=1 Tax=Peribacillus butanolivorans TaxID=421767 RepID=UPI00365935DD
MQYYNGGNGSVVVVGNGSQAFDVEKVHNIMKQYLGRPYVWGGRTPAAGGFDCSGLLELPLRRSAWICTGQLSHSTTKRRDSDKK